MAPAGTEADASFGVDDSVPRDSTVAGEGIEGVADETRVAGNPRETRDLTVSSDTSTGNP